MYLTNSDIAKLTNERNLAERTLEMNSNLTRAQKGKLLSIIRDADYKLSRGMRMGTERVRVAESGELLSCLTIIAFLFPVIGLILYCVLKAWEPKKASGVGKAAIFGMCLVIRLGLLFFFIRHYLM